MGTKQTWARVQLDTAAKKAADRLCDQRGLIQIDMLSRLLEWFVIQNEIDQAAILWPPSDSVGDALTIRLLKIVAQDDTAD